MSKKKKTSTKGKRLSVKELQSAIYRLFSRNPKKRLNAKQVQRKLKIANNKDSVQHAMEQLAKADQLSVVTEDKYALGNTTTNKNRSTRTGRVDMTRTGSADIVAEGHDDDIHVSAKYMNTALHGDIVEIKYWTPRGRRKPEGEVIRIVERATEHFLGTLKLSKTYGIVIPDKDNMPIDIYVDLKDIKDARDEDKVVVKVIKWPGEHNNSPIGVVTSVLGKIGSSDLQMKTILVNNGFELEFPEEVLAASDGLTDTISEEEVAARRDMRTVTTFTIDPDTAKDFDDALSLEYLEDGSLEIGVHIADVTHYVQPNSDLDKEALKRSTSVYLVDRVLPMLPEKLSNELCSLRPNEDKLTFSAVFTFDKDEKIVNRWFGKTLIHSDRRFTYEEAQTVLDSGEGDFASELKVLNKIAKKLRKERFKNGSIDFDAEEVKFRLDENGVPIEVYVKERKDTHTLIEDFMLLANKEVARYISEKGKAQEIPFVYRVHDEPNPDKVADFIGFAKQMGLNLKADTPEQIASAYNKIADAAKANDAFKVLEPIAIRTMAKAEYTTENIGHYGLGFTHYAHFTSPIRRYADVLVHRVLFKNLGDDVWRTDKTKLQEKCKHISLQERRAMDAERESIKYKQVEFIEKHVGEVFEGIISGIIDRGFFVELKGNKCEGFVGFESLSEPFELANSRLMATGVRSNTKIKMGDTLNVKVVGANLEKKQINLEWMV